MSKLCKRIEYVELGVSLLSCQSSFVHESVFRFLFFSCRSCNLYTDYSCWKYHFMCTLLVCIIPCSTRLCDCRPSDERKTQRSKFIFKVFCAFSSVVQVAFIYIVAATVNRTPQFAAVATATCPAQLYYFVLERQSMCTVLECIKRNGPVCASLIDISLCKRAVFDFFHHEIAATVLAPQREPAHNNCLCVWSARAAVIFVELCDA